MFGKLSKNSRVDHILVFSLTNVGDVVVTAVVLDVLLRDFPKAKISVIVGSKGETLFTDHPRIKTIVYDKHMDLKGHVQWFRALCAQRYDVLIDLRQTALGLFLPTRWRTPLIADMFDLHMKLKHLERLKAIYPNFALPQEKLAIIPKSVDVELSGRYVVISPGAADKGKRWHPQGFTQVADQIAAWGYRVIFAGAAGDHDLIEGIRKAMKNPSVSIAGKTDLRQLAYVLQRSAFSIAHDSGSMHLASYMDASVVGLWGPTDSTKSGPWGTAKSAVVSKGKDMSLITVTDVYEAIAQVR